MVQCIIIWKKYVRNVICMQICKILIATKSVLHAKWFCNNYYWLLYMKICQPTYKYWMFTFLSKMFHMWPLPAKIRTSQQNFSRWFVCLFVCLNARSSAERHLGPDGTRFDYTAFHHKWAVKSPYTLKIQVHYSDRTADKILRWNGQWLKDDT